MNTIYLDQLTTLVPKAEGVEEAMSASAGMNRDSVQSMAEDTRSRLNKLFHGPGPESVVFTPGVEAALDTVIRSLFRDGDHVLISSMENDVVMDALNDIGHEADQNVSGGVEYTRMPCNEKGQLILFDPLKGEKGFDAIEKLIRPNTKAVIVNHASEVSGTVLQVKEVSEFARRHGLLMIVNAAQTAGCVPIFMNIWGVDILTFSGSNGLFASEKIGGFLASQRAQNLLGGTDMRKNLNKIRWMRHPLQGFTKLLSLLKKKHCIPSAVQGRNEWNSLFVKYSMSMAFVLLDRGIKTGFR